ncbi:17133_t:CDS:2 [Gigaspora margarita]|uniref:17133_t:CDS:1 n=1 Tax=Gigaspora margarita TaxID=4874 RepID=A0ABN7VP29_GIGMA|nr:17133_t:CDS:2 [Gigaspora margarita]
MEDRNIENFFEVAHRKAARKKQPIIKIAILTWMINDCQPLYLLWSQSFKSFIEVVLPEFKVPSDDKAQCMIINTYTQLTKQLTELLQAPFYEATKMLSGVSYAIVCCTMHYLKKTVALPNDQDEDYYAELLYRKLDVTASQSSLTNIHSDNKIVDLAGRVDQALSISHDHVQKHKNTLVNSQQNSDPWFKKSLKATIYLSMCQYWDIPKEITLISALLDSRYKKLKFVTETQHNMLSLTNERPNVNQVNYSLIGLFDDSDEEESNMSNEVNRYLALPKEA